MRTDPFGDTWLYLTGAWPDQTAIGVWRWLFVAIFVAAVVASIVVAIREWRVDPSQRTGRALAYWAIRVLVGGMWFVNTSWKLPLFSDDNGLHYWTDQETTKAAYGWLRDLAANVFLQPQVFDAINLGTLLLELAFGLSLILGLGVRAMGAIGVLFVAQLWLGLYRAEAEWPWTYVFLMMVMALLSIEAAGRSLGLDAWLRSRIAGGRNGAARLLAWAT